MRRLVAAVHERDCVARPDQPGGPVAPSQITSEPRDGRGGDDAQAGVIFRNRAPAAIAAPVADTGATICSDAHRLPVTAGAAVQRVNQHRGKDYGVYENQEFFWRPPGTGRPWNLCWTPGSKSRTSPARCRQCPAAAAPRVRPDVLVGGDRCPWCPLDWS